ncbi:MAG: Stf0 family sulfotransferase [Chloroflexota bacterium]
MWQPYLKNIALNKGLLKGHTDYTRFIILGRSRVGSNFLRGLLNSHSHVEVFGEVFQTYEAVAWALPGYGQSPATLALYQNDPAQFVEQELFHPFPPQITAVGFKLFYYHAQDDDRQAIWPYLQSRTDIKLIHIKRRNMLKTHLSRRRAEETDVWFNLSGERETQKPLTLDYQTCLDDFVQTRRWETAYDTFFQDHDRLDVIYEDLARNTETQMAQIQSFLGVAPQPLIPETYKQARKPLSDAIANFDELKQQFAGSEWAVFFEE